MTEKRRILIAGESWTVHSIHQKGFDSFTTTEYAEGVRWLKQALETGGWDVTHQPSHVAAREFPFSAAELSAYDCVMRATSAPIRCCSILTRSLCRCLTGWRPSATTCRRRRLRDGRRLPPSSTKARRYRGSPEEACRC